jgi:methylenetetrahydrofolate dehydrogenase (NADP+)/methenyltetrahydrofolate cyclohydrolase
MKARTAEAMGVRFYNATFPKEINTDKLQEEINKINKIENMCGVIIQLPLPEHIDKRVVLDSIDSHLDVDCLGTLASKEFYEGNKDRIKLGFPTALACMAILDSLNLDLKDKKIVVLGQGMLVGKPVLALLSFRGLNAIPVTSKTENKEQIMKEADVIITGIGKGKFIKSEMVKDGVVLIDAGTSESDGGIAGDVDLDTFIDFNAIISPVPGGVGPVTVAMLLNNVLNVAKNKK